MTLFVATQGPGMEELIWEQYTVTLQKVSSARTIPCVLLFLACCFSVHGLLFCPHSLVVNLAEVGNAPLEFAGNNELVGRSHMLLCF